MFQTLEIEWLLQQRCRGGPCRALIQDAVADLESFVRTYLLGGFRLLPDAPKEAVKEDEAVQRLRYDALAAMHDGFSFFFGTKPEALVPVSREGMIGKREMQAQRYAHMRVGSFSEQALKNENLVKLRQMMGRTPVAYDGGMRQLSIDRALRTCFNTGGVTTVLKEVLGASFSKLVENEFTAIWRVRLSMAAFADTRDDGALKRLTDALKRTTPFGAVNVGSAETPCWQSFYLVE